MKLLNFNFCACSLEVCSKLLCLFLRDAFLDGLGSALNEILSILKTKTANVLNKLDNVKLGSTSAGKNNVELGLLLNNRSSSACNGSSSYGSSGYTELLLKCLNEISKFK